MADDPIDAREMIAAYRAVARPHADVKRRITRAIATPVPAPRWPYVAVGLAAAAVMVASLTLRDAWLDRSPREEARPEAQYDDATPTEPGRVEPPARALVVEEITPAAEVPHDAKASIAPVRPRAASERRTARRDPPSKPRAVAPTEPAHRDDLLAEMALLERVRSRLASGRLAEALALAEEHDRTFPRGALAEERDALRVIASCGLPDRAEAAWTARLAFARDYPRSTYAERVRRACVDLGGSSHETDIP